MADRNVIQRVIDALVECATKLEDELFAEDKTLRDAAARTATILAEPEKKALPEPRWKRKRGLSPLIVRGKEPKERPCRVCKAIKPLAQMARSYRGRHANLCLECRRIASAAAKAARAAERSGEARLVQLRKGIYLANRKHYKLCRGISHPAPGALLRPEAFYHSNGGSGMKYVTHGQCIKCYRAGAKRLAEGLSWSGIPTKHNVPYPSTVSASLIA